MISPHTGRVDIEVEGETIALRFDWQALSALHNSFGDGWDEKVDAAFSSVDALAIARVLSIASGKPEEWWLAVSPPLVPCAKAARLALQLAFFGAKEEAGGEGATNPQQPKGKRTLFSRLFGTGAS